jgi:GT2 family glycosyltransferase
VPTSPTDLSIIILSYNVKELLLNCLASIPTNHNWQIIVVDNASTDGSAQAVSEKFRQVELVISKTNVGFSAGNNLGIKKAKGEYILFLNPDTEIVGDTIEETLAYIKNHSQAGAITPKIELPNGKLDYSCHRGLPTPWNALCYFSGLSKLFPHLKLFSGYTATYQDLTKIHEIDCATGAYLLVRRTAGESIDWWDEDYFWNGEDIEFCYKLKNKDWKIIYYPDRKIIHFKGSSSGLYSYGKNIATKEMKLATAKAAAKAMQIFYKKHFTNSIWGRFVWLGVILLEKIRLFKLKMGISYA